MFWTSSGQVPYHERGCFRATMQYPADKYTLFSGPLPFTLLISYMMRARIITDLQNTQVDGVKCAAFIDA
jgi:hypothetical protein